MRHVRTCDFTVDIKPILFYIPYMGHHNLLMITNPSWIQTMHNKFENKEMDFKNGVINIQAGGYNAVNGAHMVIPSKYHEVIFVNCNSKMAYISSTVHIPLSPLFFWFQKPFFLIKDSMKPMISTKPACEHYRNSYEANTFSKCDRWRHKWFCFLRTLNKVST